MAKGLLLFIFIFVITFFYSQTFKVKYDDKIFCDEINTNDTISYVYSDSINKIINIQNPINTDVSFISNIDSLIFQNIKFNKHSDTLFINLNYYSYAVKINLELRINDKDIEAFLYYSVSGSRVESYNLQIEHLNLSLNQSQFQNNESLIGTIDLGFKGKVFSDIYVKDVYTLGKIKGCFNLK